MYRSDHIAEVVADFPSRHRGIAERAIKLYLDLTNTQEVKEMIVLIDRLKSENDQLRNQLEKQMSLVVYESSTQRSEVSEDSSAE